MKKFLTLLLFVSSICLGQQAPRHAILTGTSYVGTNPEVGGSSPFQLTVAHKRHQIVNPAGAITVKLPSVGVVAGDVWRITNRSANKVTIQDSGATYLSEITNGSVEFVALVATPAGASNWLTSIIGERAKQYSTTTYSNTVGDCLSSTTTLKICNATMSALARAVFMPYRTADGGWRVTFNIEATWTAATSGTISIAGIKTKNIGGFYQPCSSWGNNLASAYMNPNDNTVKIYLETSYAGAMASCDVELDQKPAWAD